MKVSEAFLFSSITGKVDDINAVYVSWHDSGQVIIYVHGAWCGRQKFLLDIRIDADAPLGDAVGMIKDGVQRARTPGTKEYMHIWAHQCVGNS